MQNYKKAHESAKKTAIRVDNFCAVGKGLREIIRNFAMGKPTGGLQSRYEIGFNVIH